MAIRSSSPPWASTIRFVLAVIRRHLQEHYIKALQEANRRLGALAEIRPRNFFRRKNGSELRRLGRTAPMCGTRMW